VFTKSLDNNTDIKGCDSNFKVKMFKFSKLIQMKQLSCIKQYVLG